MQPFPPPPAPVRPIRGLALTVVVLLGLCALLELLVLVVSIQRVSLVSGVIDDPESANVETLTANDTWYVLAGLTQLAVYVLTGVMFVVWLYRARCNAEAITPIPHRRSRGLVVFSWVIPIVNLWYPLQIVDDVWATSSPRNLPPDLGSEALNRAPRSPLVRFWWLLWLVTTFGSMLFQRAAARDDSLEAIVATARVDIWFAAPYVVSAVLAVLVVMNITTAQERWRLLAPQAY
ncbi:DUF4328 domain-containing protein [Streptosporangium saharense]|uniref:DUF4328 domain-containing protein n=1 Tax=Streptosporangium saharense TaxID=1706840 RepID=UPI0036B96952